MEINHLQDTALRKCSKCFQAKPLDDFYLNTTARGTKYPRPECTACHKVIHAERFQLRKDAWEPKRHAWYMNNQDKVGWSRAATRARRQGATEFLSLEEWIDLRVSTTACHWCGLTLHASFTNIDHVRPLIWGGQHTRENLVLACANCNLSREWERKTAKKLRRAPR